MFLCLIPGEERRAGDLRALGQVQAVSGSGADTADTGVVVVVAVVVSPTAAGEVAVVAGVGVVAVAAAVVEGPVAVAGENLHPVREPRGLFPGRLNKAAGFPEGLHPATVNVAVVVFV
jgi:hypothetical protein